MSFVEEMSKYLSINIADSIKLTLFVFSFVRGQALDENIFVILPVQSAEPVFALHKRIFPLL